MVRSNSDIGVTVHVLLSLLLLLDDDDKNNVDDSCLVVLLFLSRSRIEDDDDDDDDVDNDGWERLLLLLLLFIPSLGTVRSPPTAASWSLWKGERSTSSTSAMGTPSVFALAVLLAPVGFLDPRGAK